MKAVETDTSVRAAQVNLTRERILAGALSVLRQSEALTFARVASAAGLPDRTVYRHFPTAEQLEQEAWRRVLAQFANDRHPETLEAFNEHVREAFERFSADSGLVHAVLHSREVGRMRKRDDGPRRAALRKVVNAAAIDCDDAGRARLAAVLRVLYSAPAWELLTDLAGFDASEAAAAVSYAAQRMLGNARAQPRAQTSKRRK